MTDLGAVEEREARAEQLVEALARVLERVDFHEKGTYEEMARAALNVVRTEREQVTCGECRGRGEVVAGRGRTHDPVFAKCSAGCIDGSVPGELLVVGLIGEAETCEHCDRRIWQPGIEREAP